MNRQDAKDILPIIQAFAEGKTIEYQNVHRKWIEVKNPSFSEHYTEYRIKPEPKHRPFENTKECWEEMQNHQPFGWLYNKPNDQYFYITALDNHGIVITAFDEVEYYDYQKLINEYTFADGSAFGIKKD